MTDQRSHWEHGRRVTDWCWEAVNVHGGFRVGRRRWILEREGWNQELDDWAHVTPFPNREQAEAVARTLNG